MGLKDFFKGGSSGSNKRQEERSKLIRTRREPRDPYGFKELRRNEERAKIRRGNW